MEKKEDEALKFHSFFPPAYVGVERVIAEMREQLRYFDKHIEEFRTQEDVSNYASPKEWRLAEK